MDREACINFILGDGKVGRRKFSVKCGWENKAQSQLNHLIKYRNRDSKRLARETGLKEVHIRRFKQFTKR